MLIERPPEWFRRLFPGALFREEPKDDGTKRIYLTFDDGPIPESTPWVLDILDEYGVKATFFMVGDNIRKYPHLLEEVRRRGHGVGNHTFRHLKGIGTSRREYLEDAKRCEGLTGSRLFRPPHGILRYSQFLALKQRYRVVMYDLVTRDYSRRLTPEEVLANVKRYARNGSIIVFHDSLKSMPRLMEALPQSLAWLKGKGYSFEIIEEKF